MRQLWINGKRMDSLSQLRREFTDAPDETQDQLCRQLLEQAGSGALASWLGRQPEIDDDDRQSRALLALMEDTS
ncbi:MAG: hypothetical protein IIV90_02865, partial [Oscillospiraceae bacterium]|nr:hypothetical protein [Oscillospiraceae bacterium]